MVIFSHWHLKRNLSKYQTANDHIFLNQPHGQFKQNKQMLHYVSYIRELTIKCNQRNAKSNLKILQSVYHNTFSNGKCETTSSPGLTRKTKRSSSRKSKSKDLKNGGKSRIEMLSTYRMTSKEVWTPSLLSTILS